MYPPRLFEILGKLGLVQNLKSNHDHNNDSDKEDKDILGVLHKEKILIKKKFNKTGSTLFLLGGEIGKEIIQKTIPLESFLARKKAFENSDGRKKLGFDYTPIEPIITFSLDIGVPHCYGNRIV